MVYLKAILNPVNGHWTLMHSKNRHLVRQKIPRAVEFDTFNSKLRCKSQKEPITANDLGNVQEFLIGVNNMLLNLRRYVWEERVCWTTAYCSFGFRLNQH